MKTALCAWKKSVRLWWAGWRSYTVTHLVYTVLGFILFTPLIGLIGRASLVFSDSAALSDMDIAWFLLSPPGMAALVLLGALMITILGFEQATMMTQSMAVAEGFSPSLWQALVFTAMRARSIFVFALHLVARVSLIVLPFLAVSAALAWIFLTGHDINYYLDQRPPAFWLTVAGIGVVMAVMTVLLINRLTGWSLALPLVLFGGISPKMSFSESRRKTDSSKRTIFMALAVWATVALLVGMAVNSLILALGSWIVPSFFDALDWLVPVLGALVVIWLCGSFLATVFTTGSFACLLAGFYTQAEPNGMRIDFTGLEQAGSRTSRLLNKKLLVAGLVTGAIIASVTGFVLLDGIEIDDRVDVIAHRGAAGAAPENTIASVRRAIEDDADWVEIDVQETSDGEIVVIHDSDFMKLAGDPIKVWEGSLARLQEIDIGSWFGAVYSDQRVPRLTDVIHETRGKARLLIELKYYGHDEQLEQRVADIVEREAVVDEIAIMSLKYLAVEKFKALRPGWPAGLLAARSVGNLAGLEVDFLAVNVAMATPGFVRRARKAGREVLVWTVNDAVTMSRMISLGVGGIITDEPALARKVMAQRAELGPAQRLLINLAILFGRPLPPGVYRDESP